MAQEHWASIDYRKNISLIGLMRNKSNKEIVAIATYAAIDEKWAEVAFVVREDLSYLGAASYLFKELERVATENGFEGFLATTLPENSSMIRLAKKCFPETEIKTQGDETELKMKFSKK